MKCRVKNARHAAIYDTIRSLINTDPNINSVQDIVDWFSGNFPDVERSEIIDSLVLPSDKNIEESKAKVRQRSTEIRRQAKWLNKVEMLLNGELERSGRTVTDSEAVKQIKDAVSQLNNLSKSENLSDDQIEDAINMLEALPISSQVDSNAVSTAIDNLKSLAKQDSAKRDSARAKRIAQKIEGLMDGAMKPSEKKTKIPPDKQVAELTEALKELEILAGEDSEITDAQYGDIISKLMEVRSLYQRYFETDGEVSKASIDQAVKNLRDVREELRLNRLNQRIKANRELIARLSDPDGVDINDLVTDNTTIPWKPVDAEILKKQIELEDLKAKVKHDVEKLRRKKLAEKGINILGFKFTGKASQNMMNAYYTLKDSAWELPRTLSFMFDASAFGVQLAPVVISDLVSPVSNFYKIHVMKRTDLGVFSGWKRLGDVFRDGFFNVVASDLRSIDVKNDKLRSAKGSWTRNKFQEILNHPLYSLMKDSGLQISQSRSLTDSEEFYTSSLVNKVPLFGFIKDVSEDTMVTTLNLYRMSLFDQFYKANPNLSMAEYKKVAEHINNLTGTTKDFGAITGSLGYIMSAPKLLIAKMKLAIGLMAGARIYGINIPGTFREGGIRTGVKFKTPVDAFIFNNLSGMGASYAALFALTSVAAAMIPGLDFEEDWEESDFLRIKYRGTAFDITGGLGAIYRTMAASIYLTFGPSEAASDDARDRINYLINVKKKDALDAIIQNMFRNKLHPTINTSLGVFSGKDFFGDPYELFGEVGPVASRLASLKALLPIFLNTTVEQYFYTPNSGPVMDSGVNLLQFFGVNTFEYSDKSRDVRVKKYLNEVEFMPKIKYPDEFKTKKEGLELDHLKNKYKQQWGDALGELVLENGANVNEFSEKEFKRKWEKEKDKIDKEFLKEWKDNIEVVEEDQEKVEKAKEKKGRSRRRTRERRRRDRD